MILLLYAVYLLWTKIYVSVYHDPNNKCLGLETNEDKKVWALIPSFPVVK